MTKCCCWVEPRHSFSLGCKARGGPFTLARAAVEDQHARTPFCRLFACAPDDTAASVTGC